MPHLITILILALTASCASPIQQESGAIIHESVTPAPTPCAKDCPVQVSEPVQSAPMVVATPSPTVVPKITPEVLPQPFVVKKKKKPKAMMK